MVHFCCVGFGIVELAFAGWHCSVEAVNQRVTDHKAVTNTLYLPIRLVGSVNHKLTEIKKYESPYYFYS